MNLLNKLCNTYKSPEIKLQNITEDVMTSSIQKAKLSPEDMVEVGEKQEQTKKMSFFEKYPDGLPREVLEMIDYTKFGAMLKQQQLLPPSYDKTPVNVKIDMICEKPRVILTFKSKTSENLRLVSIYGYDVSYSDRIKLSNTCLTINPIMIELWREFAEYIMDYWDSSFRFEVMRKDF